MKLLSCFGLNVFLTTIEASLPMEFFRIEQIYQILKIITIVVGLFLMSYIYQRAKRDNILKSYIFMNLSMIVWTIGLLFESASWADNYMQRFAPLWFSYLGICSLGFGFLLFCLYLSGNRWIQEKKNIILLAIPPAVFYILLLTNQLHQFVYIVPEDDRRSFGWGYYLLTFTIFIYICIGIFTLIKSHYRSQHRTRYKLFFLILLIGVFTINLILELVFKWRFEAKPLTFVTVSSAFFFYGSVRLYFFSIVPVSYHTFIQSMDDGVLILDSGSNIVSFNGSLQKVIKNKKVLRNDVAVSHFVEQLKLEMEQTAQSSMLTRALLCPGSRLENAVVKLDSCDPRFYSVNIQPVINWRGQLLARIVMFSDITEFNNLNVELEGRNNEIVILNRELTEANEELLRQSLMMEEIAATDERNRILKELYSSIQETFKSILIMVNACKNSVKSGDSMMVQNLNEMIHVTKDGLNEIRSSIYYQKDKIIETNSFVKTLEKLLNGKYDLSVEFYFHGSTREIPYHIRYAIYITCQEALENSALHGRAKLVYVILQFKETRLDIVITDDGIGCENLVPGKGLSKINELCHELGGILNYGSSDENQGFSLHQQLPLV